MLRADVRGRLLSFEFGAEFFFGAFDVAPKPAKHKLSGF
jgi:hypothetical protein